MIAFILSLAQLLATPLLTAPPRTDPCLRVSARTTEVACDAHEADRSPPSLDLSGLTVAKKLKTLSITGYAVASLEPLRELTQLTRVTLHDNGGVALAPLSALTNLTEVSLAGADLGTLDFLAQAKSLSWLSLEKGRARSLSALGSLPKLETVVVKDVAGANLRELAGPSLTLLDVQRSGLTDLSFVAALPKLRKLALMEPALASLAGLERAAALKQLYLRDMKALVDISALGKLDNLSYFALSGAAKVDLGALAQLERLESFEVRDVPLADIAWLAGSPGILSVVLVNTKVSDLSVLAKLTKLRSVNIAGSPAADLTPLAQLPELDTLIITGTPSANAAAVKAFKASRPKRAPAITIYFE